MGPSKHAKLSPSSSGRWMHCPGSIALIEKCPPERESSYALEGTAAHALAEKCLRDNVHAKDIYKVEINDFQDYEVNDEMREAVQVYLDTVRDILYGGCTMYTIEEKFDLHWLHGDISGTNDCCIVKGDTLYVLDYKHGAGIAVDPYYNPQLMIYALGACHKYRSSLKGPDNIEKAIKKIKLIIVQPRVFGDPEPAKTWEISASELYNWGLHVLKPAAIATEEKDARLCAGSHCRFCPALAICPEQIKQACALTKTDFDDPILPLPQDMTPKDIAKVMSFSDLISSWVNEVRAYAQAQAELGVTIPGYKLVPKRATRKWIDETKAAQVLADKVGSIAFESKLLSVSKLEKVLKKACNISLLLFEDLFEKKSTGSTLVPETDARREIVKPALSSFIESEDFLN